MVYTLQECRSCNGFFTGEQMGPPASQRCRDCLRRGKLKLAMWACLLGAATYCLVLYIRNLPPPLEFASEQDVSNDAGEMADSQQRPLNAEGEAGAGTSDHIDDAVRSAITYDMSDRQLMSAFRAATSHSEMFTVETEYGESAYITPRKLLNMPFGNVLLANVTVKQLSHSASGGIRIYYLQSDGNGFSSSGTFDEIYTSGSGLPPEKIIITSNLTAYPALYIDESDGNGGYSYGWAQLIELRPEGASRSDNIPVSYSNSDAMLDDGVEPVDLEGKITNILRDKSFDVVDVRAGIREHYIRSGTKFVRAGAGKSKFDPE